MASRIGRLTGSPPVRFTFLGGGCIAAVQKVLLEDGRTLAVKIGGPGDNLDLEGFMLDYLAKHSSLPVPEVIHAGDDLLLMNYLDQGGGLDGAVQEHAALLVAGLHGVGSGQFGFAQDTVIGGLRQPNSWSGNWPDFFRDQRLLYMGNQALAAGRLSKATMHRLETLAGRLDRWLDNASPPSLIHGDMWTGNVLSDGRQITGFIDPAIYYADPEIELAFTTLFSTFGDAFFRRYHELRPIRPGFFEERLYLYNLYPLLVHVRLFGGNYVNQVERALRRFGV